MAVDVILPRVDMDMASGRISRWLVDDGAVVTKGAPIFEIETDKAAMEIEAPASGIFRTRAALDEDLPVGTTVALILAEGETPETAEPPAPALEPAAPTGASAGSLADRQQEPPATDSAERNGSGLRATPLARRIARLEGIDLAAVPGTGPKGRIQAEDVRRIKNITPATTTASIGGAKGPLHATWLREGEGIPLVLVHGFGADLDGWRPLVQAAEPGRPVFAMDLPGHGGSPLDAAATIEVLVDRVAATIASAGIERAVLVGHSLGAAVAAGVADRATFDLRSLMLLSPAGLGPEIDGAFLAGYTRSRSEISLAPWMRRLVADPGVSSDGFVRATARARAAGTVAEDQERLAQALFPDGTQAFSIGDVLARIAVPVRVVTGIADRIVPARHTATVPGHVAVHRLAGVGHMPHIEARETVVRILAELVRSSS